MSLNDSDCVVVRRAMPGVAGFNASLSVIGCKGAIGDGL